MGRALRLPVLLGGPGELWPYIVMVLYSYDYIVMAYGVMTYACAAWHPEDECCRTALLRYGLYS